MTEHIFLERLRAVDLISRTGRVRKVSPTHIEADGPSVSLGAICEVETRSLADGEGGGAILAEVVGVHAETISLAPLVAGQPTFSGARVTATNRPDRVPVGEAFLGRAVNGLGQPIDGGAAILAERFARLDAGAPSPLDRDTPRRVLETGVRAIDGLLTLGHGQRVGVFAASGVGKSSLVLDIAQQVQADRCVACLIGERGREVEAFWSRGLSAEAKARTTLVAATSDQPAALRVRAANYALALAEHWRAQGLHVLLLLDSVTRLAMAMREIGLAAGEPPTVRAYTPTVFSAIPRLVERCGALKAGGAITSLMTILSETDDVDDPISEMMKSLLDGHIVLSRSLAEQGQYPAVDVPRSISRLADGLRGAAHRTAAEQAVKLLGVYETSRTLIEAGVYVAGSNPDVDLALQRRPGLVAYLKQRHGERTPFADACGELARAVGGGA
ncbi:MAG TPA: FliI/YscN family ATPase [Caulobacteraceae bacterium]|jgi:flagellum-specific ATP synthase